MGINSTQTPPQTTVSDVKSHMANERTHLAYLRTSLSLMSFGIALNRFSIFLKESKLTPKRMELMLYDTASIGLGVVLLGVFILLWALYRYHQVNHAIMTKTYKSPKVFITILTATIVILGGVSAIWLLIDWN